MDGWTFVYEGFDPAREGLREALCTLGNGYFATRGAAPEAAAGGVHYPGTYLAGGYNRLVTEIDGLTVENEDLVNLPNWLPLTFRIDGGAWFDLGHVELLTYRQELDLRHGILTRVVRFRDEQGRCTALRSRRFVHMRERHLAGLETTITPEDWAGTIEVRSALDGRVVNAGVQRYAQLNNRHLEPLGTAIAGEHMLLRTRLSQSRIEVALAARTRVSVDGEPVAPLAAVEEIDEVAQQFVCEVTPGSPVTVEKIAALYTSRDLAISEASLEAGGAVERAGGFSELLRGHSRAWEQLWRRFDIEARDSEHVESILRLHIFHLLQTVSPNTIELDAGVPARGLHGEAYRGHVFWDELFIFPLLNLRMPELTRALLRYRYRRLPEARRAAREAGHRGAMYPWQGGSDGREESQRFHLNPRSGRWVADHTYLQRHINAAIAYNIWQYYQVTGDAEFLSAYGAEMFLEIARFWASIATYNPELDRYEICGVVGPDEYHDGYPDAEMPGVDNNAYTNVMAAWVLCRARDVFDLLPRERCHELCETLALEKEEIARWEEISRKLRVVFHDDGVISQFEGYEQLEELDWDGYRERYGDIQRLDRILEADGDTPNRYKASKQADVLMLFYLFSAAELRDLFHRLGYPFDHEMIGRNVRYYLQRTSHGSTLSRVVHSWVLAWLDRPRSWRFFTEALESDVTDIQGGTTAEGIHLGAMAGTVDLIQRGFTGIEARGDALWFNPSLPEHLPGLRIRLRYRSHWLDVEVTGRALTVGVSEDSAEPVRIGFREQVHQLQPGETREFAL